MSTCLLYSFSTAVLESNKLSDSPKTPPNNSGPVINFREIKKLFDPFAVFFLADKLHDY